jgi:aminoglycoside phosphotransferase (APT) family kinase protein
MAPPLALDLPAATRLAGLDPALAHLARVCVAAEEGHWQLDDARWTPGEGCRLAYRVPASAAESTFLEVRATPTGWAQRDYREDESLPGLAQATDPVAVAARLGGSIGEPVTGLRVDPVRYRPGSRCVLRYDVLTATRAMTLYAKVFRHDDFSATAPVITAIAEHQPSADLVPPVVALWPDLHAVVVLAVPGRPVSAVFGDPSVPEEGRLALARRMGEVLAHLHSRTDVDAPPWTADDQVRSLKDALVAVGRADAALATRLDDVSERLASSRAGSTNEVLGHGAFRPGQVLRTAQGGLVVLDLDGVYRGAPERDVATVLSHLAWQGVRHPELALGLDNAARSFLAGYREESGVLDENALRWWRAASLLQVAARRFRRLETQDWDLTPALVDAAAGLLEGPTSSHPPVAPKAAAFDPLDTDRLTPLFRTALSHVVPGARQLTIDAATEVSSAAGRRRVIRYDVNSPDGAAAGSVWGKVFTDLRRADLLHRHLLLLSDASVSGTSPLVHEPLALLPEVGMVLFPLCEGTPLSSIDEPLQARRGVEAAADWLAQLHSSPVRLPRTFALEQEALTSRAWANLIGRAHPDLADQAWCLAERWAATARSVTAASVVPIHKDFHPGHVLVGGPVRVVDFDEARQGDPAFDLAHFTAYAELLGTEPLASALSARFLEAYAAATDWVDHGSFAAFRAYACLKIARQWATGSGPCRGEPLARRRAGVEQALERGLTWLNA